MRHDHSGFAPFGEDEDANRAVRSFAGVVGLLAQEAQKLDGMKTSNLNLRSAQEARVAELRSEIRSRAASVHVDPDEFLEACRKDLERRTGRKVTIPTRVARPEMDEEERTLTDAVLEAEIAEANRKRLLAGAQKRADEATAAANAAQARLSAYRANRRVLA